MPPDQILITLFCFGGILFTHWFFLMKKEETVEIKDRAMITVKGGYSPEIISIPKGKKTNITFIRKDTNSCLEEITLGDFHIRKYLPLNQKVIVSIFPEKEGIYIYSCALNMYHGTIVVK